MKIFIDTANVDEIKAANDLGVICGVTTNPSLIAKEGRIFEEVVQEITTIVDGPISAEVISLEADKMVEEALELANAKQALEESLDVELDDDVFEDLGDVPVSIWIDVKSDMIVRIEMDMSDVMQGLVPVLVDKAMEKTDIGIGVNTKVYEVTVSITLSEFDAVQVTKPTTLNIG